MPACDWMLTSVGVVLPGWESHMVNLRRATPVLLLTMASWNVCCATPAELVQPLVKIAPPGVTPGMILADTDMFSPSRKAEVLLTATVVADVPSPGCEMSKFTAPLACPSASLVHATLLPRKAVALLPDVSLKVLVALQSSKVHLPA